MSHTRSELRRDPVSGDWVVIAPRRGARPHHIGKGKTARRTPCPFEDKRQTADPVLVYGSTDQWSLQIIPNKFPAFSHSETCAYPVARGLYQVAEGVGYHDVLITRDHRKDFSDLPSRAASDVLRAFRERYSMLAHDHCIAYISLFHNWGKTAGASVEHPHYQIIAIPVIPPDVSHSLRGSMAYTKKHGSCVHCAMIVSEKKEKRRILFENKDAIVFAPFVSREPFEMRVFPKRHQPYFEETLPREIDAVSEALQSALRMMNRTLKKPDYNFFIHTAPLKEKKKYANYHWHIEVLPKVNISAGFELGTGIEINSVDPDDAARALKK